MKDRAQAILEAAASDGVCRTGRRYLKQTPRDATTLIKLMKAWPEYIQEHPDSLLDTIRQHIDDDLRAQLHAANIYIDYRGPVTLGSDTAVYFLGDSRVEITTAPFAVIKIYLFHHTRASITPSDSSIIDLEAWNHALAIFGENDTASTTAHVYDQAGVTGANNTQRKDHQGGQVFNGKEINHNKK